MQRLLRAGMCVLGWVATAQATLIESEPNNTIPTANPIIVGIKPWANVGVMPLSSVGDVDVFSISLLKDDLLTVVATPVHPMFTNPNTLLGLFDSGGGLLALDDDSALGGIATGSTIRFFVPADATYYLAVTGAGDVGFTGQHSEPGPYILAVSVEPIPEPASALLLTYGLGALARRQR